MSMTREEAIKALRLERDIEINGNAVRVAEFLQGLDVAISALRPASREQVEKVWRGQWLKCKHADYYVCNKCSTVSKTGEDEFCKSCGAPMTGKAVEMVMERLEALKDETD